MPSYRRTAFIAALAMLAVTPATAEVERVDPSATAKAADLAGYTFTAQSDRFTVFVHRSRRGTSVPIDQAKLSEFCSDLDGCSVRIGMHNWDNTGRIASREFLFFYNAQSGNWSASLGDAAGSDKNNVTEHVNNSWSCYMTDSTYVNRNHSDTTTGFGLLSWDQYNADCVLTVID
jgi:hypothetical protein